MVQSKKDEKEKLADFQNELLNLLGQELPADEIFRRLKTDPRFDDFRDYIETFELQMVEVGAVLVKKWGRKRNQETD